MPQPLQTPAGRRFLPPTTTQKPYQRESAPSSSIKYSQHTTTSQVARSPFARTSFVSGAEDDIDTSFDGEDEISPAPAPSSKHSQFRRQYDAIEDNSQDSILSEDRILRRNSAIVNINRLPHRKDYEFSSAEKRRKLSHPDHETGTTSIRSGSSSPKSGGSPDPNDITIEQPHVEPHSSHETMLSSPDIDIRTPQQNSRFRHVLPSSTISSGSKFTFQTALSAATRGPHPIVDAALPDAFSPSRRKGAQDYLHDGMAATVRRWVLELGAQESRSLRNSESNQTFLIANVVQDPGGRFVLVEDESENKWLLIEEQQSRLSKSKAHSKVQRVGVGDEIRLKGGPDSIWDLPLLKSEPDFKVDEIADYKVAVLWDVVR